MTDPNTEPAPAPAPTPEVLHRLLTKIDGLDLQGDERALMWAILSAAKEFVYIVDVPGQGPWFANEFATAYSTDPAARAASGAGALHFATCNMIVR